MILGAEPKVSIILPTYNGASKYLRESIKSCLDQTYRNLELIIVDDGSFDHTSEVVKSFCDHRVRCIRHLTNMGLPSALNIGFRVSTGELLTWTSDDNEYFTDAIERMVAALRSSGEAAFVYADYYALYEGTGRTELRKLPDQVDLARGNCIGSCFLYTRRVYETIGDYDPRYELVEDYEYWIRVARHFKMLHYPRPLYTYREHSRSLKSTRTHSAYLFESILKFEKRYISTTQLWRSVYRFCTATVRSEGNLRRSTAIWRQTHSRVSALSLTLGLWFIVLSLSAIGLGALQLFKRGVDDVLEAFRFRYARSRLKPSYGRRHVLCLCPSLTAGGAEAVVLSLARELSSKGYGFHLLTTRSSINSWQDKFLAVFKTVIMLTPGSGERRRYDYITAMIDKLGIELILISNSGEDYQCLPQLSSTHKDLKIVDVLHAEGWMGTSDDLLWVTPYIHRRVCVTHHLRSYMRERYRVHRLCTEYADRLRVIHNGTNVQPFVRNELRGRFKSRFGIPVETKVISYVGRLSPEKRPLLFVDVAEKLTQLARPGALKFVMAGSGPQFEQVKERISSGQLEDDVVLAGLIDNVEELFADTYLLLIVSDYEGMPFVVLEAMAAGVPVISTDVGGIREVIRDGVNGHLVFPEGDVADHCASQVLRLLDDEEAYVRLSINARTSIVPEYSLETMGKLYEQLFEELTSETRTMDATGAKLGTWPRKAGEKDESLPADHLPIRTAHRE